MTEIGWRRVPDAAAVAGGVAWVWLAEAGVLGPIAEILALATLVLVPLGLGLADTPRRDGSRTTWYEAAVLFQPVAAVPTVVSLSLPAGATATALAVPWFVATALVASFGLWRLLQRGPWPLAELALDAGLVYLAVGGGALLLDRAGIALFFEPILITLTAVHFHYAGFALPVATGLAGRAARGERLGKVRKVTTAVIAVGPGIIATGITAAALQFPFAGVVEFTSVAFFTTAVALFSLSVVVDVLPGLDSRLQRLLVGAASLAVTASMGFAVLYGLARWTGGSYLGIDARAFTPMIRYHGQLNAFGFALLALLGWRLAPPENAARAPGIPFSRLAAGRRVGRDFLDRNGYATDRPASGMMASVDDYGWEGFDPDAVAPSVRRFYERSGDYLLAVEPDWGRPWESLVPGYRAVATRVDQLTLPLSTVATESALTGDVVGVDGPDDHAGSRAWIRSNANATDGDDQMTYVATYGRYVDGGTVFLRATFPLPGANLTGLLRVENCGPDGRGLLLSSDAAPGNADDAGLYLVVRGFGVRLPLDETLVISPAEGEDVDGAVGDHSGTAGAGPATDADGAVTAVHEIRALGHRVVTLAYDIEVAPEHSG